MDDLFMPLDEKAIRELSVLALAHVGDAVYELLARSMLCRRGPSAVAQLHKQTVSLVNAAAQARAAAIIVPELSAEELAVYKRSRNAHVNSVPHSSSVGDYHAATGLEALFGWLYLLGRRDRIRELFVLAMEEKN